MKGNRLLTKLLSWLVLVPITTNLINSSHMKKRQQEAHMDVAYRYAQLSYAKRKKVGCILVKDNRIISIGYNGTPPGWSNCCEDENNTTLPEVIHAERNALNKLENSPEDAEGSTAFVTCSPCIQCAEAFAKAQVKEIFYHEIYRDLLGIERLTELNIPVTQFIYHKE